MSILNVNTIQPIGSGTTVTVAATELKTSNFITVGTGASVTSPSANVLTLGTNTAERFRITSAGSIGIGTDNPGTKLDVRGGNWSNGDIVVGQTGNAGRVKFRRGADGSDSAFIGFAAADNNSRLSIGVDSGDGTIAFQTNSTERLRIDSAGSVIIGDSDTDNANAIANDLVVGNTSQRSGITIVSGTGDDGNIFFSDGTGTAALKGQIVYNHTSDRFSFYTAAAERLRIDSSGRLLIGRTSTSHEHPLQVQAASGANAIAIQGRSVDDQSEITFYENDNSTILGQIQHLRTHSTYRSRVGYLRFDSGGYNEKMRLDSSGRLLIGTTTEGSGNADNLTVADSGHSGITIRSGTSSHGSIYFSDATSGGGEYDGYIEYEHANRRFNFGTAGNTRLRITSSGHVLRPTMAAACCTTTGSTTLSTFNTSYQTIALNVEGYDNANNFNTSNYRFTAPETGFYQVGCNVQLENGSGSNTNNWMYFYPLINGSDPATSTGNNHADFDPTDTFYYSWNYSTILKLSQNDYVEWKYRGNLTSISLKGGVESTYYFYQVG